MHDSASDKPPVNPQVSAQRALLRIAGHRGVGAVLCLALLLSTLVVHALEPAEIDQRIAEIERSRADDAGRRELIAIYHEARAFAEAAAASRVAQDKLRSAAGKTSETLRALASEQRTVTRALATEPLTTAERQLGIPELEALLEAAKTDRTLSEGRLRNYEQRLDELQNRPAAIPGERSEIAQRINALETQLGDDTATAGDERSRARRVVLEAELAARQAALDAVNEEQATQNVRAQVLEARRALAQLQVQVDSQRSAALEQHLLAMREAQARMLLADATAAGGDAAFDPAVRELARGASDLGGEISRIVAEQTQTNQARDRDQALRERLTTEYELARERVDIAGNSASFGRVLVDQRRALPAPRSLALRARAIDATVTRIVLRRIEIDDLRRTLNDGLATVSGDAVDSAVPDRLRTQQRELLTAVDAGYVSYLRTLAAADVELQRLLETTLTYAAFLDEHLLWLPNAPRLGSGFLRDLWGSLRWMADFGTWSESSREFGAAFVREAGWMPLALAGLVLILAIRRPLKRHLQAYAQAVRQRLNDRLRNTVNAIAATTLLALPLPLALWLTSTMLSRAATGQFAAVLAQALAHATSLSFVCLWWREALRGNGLAIAHFGWHTDSVRRLRTGLDSFTIVFVPAFALATMFEWQGRPFLQNGVGRLAFICAMLAAAGFTHWLLRDQGPVQQQLTGGGRTTLLARTRRGWAAPLVALPLVFIALSAFGYHYTALELSGYYTRTLMLLLGALLVYNLTIRWLLVAETRLALKRVWGHHDERGVAASNAQGGAPAVGRDEEVDLATVSVHTRLVLRNAIGWSMALGLYWIWKDVLPALAVFERVGLWEIAVQGVDGATVTQAITLASVVFAAIIVGITIIGSRNLPGVMEIALLQRLHLQPGNRYAYTTLAQYLIIAVGISFALSTLGLQWSQIQWLIAALGVGLGFGLQEIFANFISGLILLFERPIRVGDIVTIGEATGTVSRIRIRATTLADWDNKELIVPNKNFITERFVNWTLTDSVQRLVIQLGVAYGSDPDEVLEILRRTMADNPRILSEPPPAAFFTEFGDSALKFRLQGFVRAPDELLSARNELHIALNTAFRSAGIAIPFPQRDIHVRSVSPGTEVPVVPADRRPAGPDA